MIAVLFRVEPLAVTTALQSASEKLDAAEGELVLDFCSVKRLTPGDLKALQELADAASSRGIRIALRSVNVDVYKVLKLVKLTPHLSFLT